MRDCQYVSSLAVTAAVLGLGLGGLVSVPLWLGWMGAIGLLTAVSALLAWFYWGPRPDLTPKDGRATLRQAQGERTSTGSG
jgi:hypothetical protein